VVAPGRAGPGPEGGLDGRTLRGVPTRRHRQSRAVLEPVLAHDVELHQVELALKRSPGLAEQVPKYGGQHRRRRPGVPAVAVLLDEPDRTADPVQPLDQGDVVAELGQPRRGRRATGPTTDDHDTHGHAA
jgi:hypothetical protein